MIRRITGALLLCALTACPASKKAMSIDTYEAQVEDAFCSMTVKCNLMDDAGLCATMYEAAFQRETFGSLPTIMKAVNAGRVRFDPVAAQACLAHFNALSCDRFMLLESETLLDCGVFTGTVPDGQRCVADVECQPGSLCRETSAATCEGVCEPRGDRCYLSSQCASGEECRFDAYPHQCVTPVPAGGHGEPCGTNGACQEGLYCAHGTSGVICQPLAALHEPCSPEALENPCVAGLMCVPSDDLKSNSCERPKARGEACTLVAECGGSLSTSACNLTTHRCVERPRSGPCVSGSILGCDVLTSYCDAATNTCLPFKQLGEICDPARSECDRELAFCDGEGGVTPRCAASDTETPGTCTP